MGRVDSKAASSRREAIVALVNLLHLQCLAQLLCKSELAHQRSIVGGGGAHEDPSLAEEPADS